MIVFQSLIGRFGTVLEVITVSLFMVSIPNRKVRYKLWGQL